MSEIDTSDYVIIKITKAKSDGQPFTWYLDIEGGEFDGSGGTAPSFAGVYDMAYSIIAGGDKHNGYKYNEWVEFDANEWIK